MARGASACGGDGAQLILLARRGVRVVLVKLFREGCGRAYYALKARERLMCDRSRAFVFSDGEASS